MQIPILRGVYSDMSPDFRTGYPVNLMPVPLDNGISKGYLRPAEGIVSLANGPGRCRGGINWNGVCYRVMGQKLCTVSAFGAFVELGDVADDGHPVRFAYSFDRLAIASAGKLYYWKTPNLTLVTDKDLGNVLDVEWVDGYFLTTDGTSLVVTELNDPTSVNPLKYGSSEVDPDPIKAVLKVRTEIQSVGRYTIEAYDNVGGDFFPFQRIEGAMVQKGSVGTHSCCVFQDAVAFVGGGRNEPPAVYVGINAQTIKLSTREIETILAGYTEEQLANECVLESRSDRSNWILYVHLPDRTLAYDALTSKMTGGEPVWYHLTSARNGWSSYRARHFVWCNDQWTCGDTESNAVGHLSDTTGDHWESRVRWEFGTVIAYNGGLGIIFHELELVGLTGRIDLGDNPKISTSYSFDGMTWSQPRMIDLGMQGDTRKRLVWRRQGMMRNWRIQRFSGDSSAHISFARLEAQIETLGR